MFCSCQVKSRVVKVTVSCRVEDYKIEETILELIQEPKLKSQKKLERKSQNFTFEPKSKSKLKTPIFHSCIFRPKYIFMWSHLLDSFLFTFYGLNFTEIFILIVGLGAFRGCTFTQILPHCSLCSQGDETNN